MRVLAPARTPLEVALRRLDAAATDICRPVKRSCPRRCSARRVPTRPGPATFRTLPGAQLPGPSRRGIVVGVRSAGRRPCSRRPGGTAASG
jgi:hypothetical protein